MKVIAADDEEEDGEDDEEPRAGSRVFHHQLAEDPVSAGEAASNTWDRNFSKIGKYSWVEKFGLKMFKKT